MKKLFLLFTALLFIGATAFSQTRKPVFIVPDSTTAFGVTMPSGMLIFDTGSKRIWTLGDKVGAVDDLSTSVKTLFIEGGASASDLETVLTAGNASTTQDILLKTNALKFSSTDAIVLDESFGEFSIVNNDISGVGAINSKLLSGAATSFNSFNVSNHIWQQTGVGTTGQFVIDFSAEQVPFLQFKDNGVGAFGFRMDLKATSPMAANRVITFPDLTGTVGLTSQLLENSDITPTATRTINLAANDFIFNTTTGQVGIGTATPQFKLHVKTTGTDGIRIEEDAQTLDIRPEGTSGLTEFNTSDAGFQFQFGTGGRHFRFNGTTAGNILMYLNGASLTGFDFSSSGGSPVHRLYTSGANSGLAIFNENGAATGDFRAESDNNANMIFVDASADAVGIGTGSPDGTSILDLTSVTRGLLPPRMTTGQRDAIISPATGLMIYNSVTNTMQFYNASVWGNI